MSGPAKQPLDYLTESEHAPAWLDHAQQQPKVCTLHHICSRTPSLAVNTKSSPSAGVLESSELLRHHQTPKPELRNPNPEPSTLHPK